MSDWLIRNYQISDMGKIISLINQVQPHVPFTRERWKWEYLDCPNGSARVWVIDHSGEIIGHAGMLEFDTFVDGERERIYLWVDAMTHPSYRRLGLHAQLVAKMIEYFKEGDTPLSYVFPNEQSIKQLENDKWVKVAAIPLLTADLERSSSFAALGGIEIREVDRFGAEIDRLSESLKECFRFSLVRTQAYLSRRYLEKPDDTYTPYLALRQGRVVGYMIYKLFDKPDEPRRSHIVDLWTDPGDRDAMAALIRHAGALAEQAKSTEVSTWMLPHAPLFPVLDDHGFKPQSIDRYFFANVSKQWAHREAVGDFANWYLTMGDSDVY